MSSSMAGGLFLCHPPVLRDERTRFFRGVKPNRSITDRRPLEERDVANILLPFSPAGGVAPRGENPRKPTGNPDGREPNPTPASPPKGRRPPQHHLTEAATIRKAIGGLGPCQANSCQRTAGSRGRHFSNSMDPKRNLACFGPVLYSRSPADFLIRKA